MSSILDYGTIKADLYRLCGSKASSVRDDIADAVRIAVSRAQQNFALAHDWSFLHQLTDRVDIPLAAPYETGTVTVTQDSKTITGSGTTWTRDMEGSFFQVGSGETYEIRTFVSATSLTLAIPYQFTTASAQDYTIYKRFYPLPLNFVRPFARDCKLVVPGLNNIVPLAYSNDASFTDMIQKGKPAWFAVVGNTRNNNYYDIGTITIATSSGTSTWTVSTGTLPTDIVDREIRVLDESRSYYISSRVSATALTTYNTYVNPDDSTNTLSDASSYAITPKETKLVGFSSVADQRYVFSLSYIKFMEDMILDSDVSPIVNAGYSDAFLAMCRSILAQDGRTAMRGDQVNNLKVSAMESLANAWAAEQQANTLEQQGAVRRFDRIQVGPSYISR